MKNNLIFHQLFETESSTYTYLMGDPVSKEAVIIDPVIETLERDLKLIEELGLHLKYILDTHVHADHITASGELRKRTGAKVGLSSAYDLSCPDLHLEDGQELRFGDHVIHVLHTPGHTSGCVSYHVEDMVFTGDALLIRGCGRTDFQEGSSEKLFSSVTEKIFRLPDETTVYPGHDYKGFSKSSIGLEKKFNPRLHLGISKDEFVGIMGSLKLALPKKIHQAVPANLSCGLMVNDGLTFTGNTNGISTVTAETLQGKLGHFKIIDVRGIDEFNNEMGHIPRAELATLGTALEDFLAPLDKSLNIVFVCRSGKRSFTATKIAMEKGFKNAFNLDGGMLKWAELGLPIERDRGGS